MGQRSTYIRFCFLAILWNINNIEGIKHLLLIEDEKIFSNCDDKPNSLGIESLLDMSNLKVEIGDETVTVDGTIEVVWDVEPTDRITLKAEVLKQARGSWQPTVFSVFQNDLCTDLFKEDGMWYTNWGQFVDEADRKCINEKGTIYHHVPFNLEMVLDIEGEKTSGIHKIVFETAAFKSPKEKRSEICVQILVDVIVL